MYKWYQIAISFITVGNTKQILRRRSSAFKSISLRPIVRKTVPAQPFVRHPPLPLFCFPPPVTVFQTVGSRLPNGTPSCPNPKKQPSLNQKGYFISSTVAFYQKSIFNFLNPFTNISGYLNLSDIFRFIFFLQMHDTFCKE